VFFDLFLTPSFFVCLLHAGHDTEDPTTYLQPRVTLNNFGPGASLSGVRIGVWREWLLHAEPPIVAACEQILHTLHEKDAEMHNIGVENLGAGFISHMISLAYDINSYVKANKIDVSKCSQGLQLHLALANMLSEKDNVLAQRWRTHVIDTLKGLFSRVDVVFIPSIPCLAPELEETDDLQHMMELARFSFLSNLTGFPALSVPIGNDARTGLPISCSIMCRPWHENTALRVARIIETFCARKQPIFSFSQLPFA
jgi:Asp-tRNA(Asn)/Glu-tRNA(Gln) amidotransferase A subunit family amidase